MTSLGSSWAVAAVLTVVGMAALRADDKPTSIACSYKTENHGNAFSVHAWLDVAGPEKKTWRYAYQHESYLGAKPRTNRLELTGTYELAGDLALFTGKAVVDADGKKTTRDIRFGVNYGFVAGHVYFNQFLPVAGDTMRLHRKWFVQRGADWFPAEERTYAIPADAIQKDSGAWRMPLTAERTRWDEKGEKTSEKFDKTLTWTRDDSKFYSCQRDVTLPLWLQGAMRPQTLADRVEAIVFADGFGIELRGFHPHIADPPAK